MWKLVFIPFFFLLVAVSALTIVIYDSRAELQYEAHFSTDTYREYRFEPVESDFSYSRHALLAISKQESMFHEGAAITPYNTLMQPHATTLPEHQQGIIEKRSFGNDIYELRSTGAHTLSPLHSVFVNDKLLFTNRMEYGAEGPILDWRIVNDVPAFTYRLLCTTTCETDVYYKGSITRTYNVKNPRYLFSFDGKIGFIASDDEGDKIFFDGTFITPAFDNIHTHNCCAIQELLPTIYDNGTLLFYAERHDEQYLVELKLTQAVPTML